MGFLTLTIAIIATSILVLWGLRGTAAEVDDSWKHSEFNIPQEAEDADHEPGDRATNAAPPAFGIHSDGVEPRCPVSRGLKPSLSDLLRTCFLRRWTVLKSHSQRQPLL